MTHAEQRTEARGLRQILLDDHARLERLFERVVSTFRGGDREQVGRVWTEFDNALTAHLEAEEKHLVPVFEQVDPAGAAAVLKEHEHFRSKLAELGVGVDLHWVGTDVARAFVDELRAHAQREDAALYRWAERSLDAEAQRAVKARLSSVGRSGS